MKHFFKNLSLFLTLLSGNAIATQYTIPTNGDTLLGNIEYINAAPRETTTTVAHHYNLGLNALMAANPGTTERYLSTTHVKVPAAFILPPFAHHGIIINLPEMRLYYYPEGEDSVMTFPIGIGKIGNTIPIHNTTVSRKTMNPTWTPGPDVRKYNAEQGIDLPRVMPAGPDNPLGPYAIYLNIPSFLIHSTIFPESIGRRASFGCIRMNETDIKDFYPLVAAGTQVIILNMPNKAGWQGKYLYLEAHPPLEEENPGIDAMRESIVATLEKNLPTGSVTLVNWQMAAHLAEEPDGVPHNIGVKIR
jgi:L,D-transpeptidase ErfK/SrfK